MTTAAHDPPRIDLTSTTRVSASHGTPSPARRRPALEAETMAQTIKGPRRGPPRTGLGMVAQTSQGRSPALVRRGSIDSDRGFPGFQDLRRLDRPKSVSGRVVAVGPAGRCRGTQLDPVRVWPWHGSTRDWSQCGHRRGVLSGWARRLTLVLVAGLALGGCECGTLETPGANGGPQPKLDAGAPAVRPAAALPPFAVGEVSLSWADIPPLEAPEREVIAGWCKAALLAHDEFSGESTAGATLRGEVRAAGGEAKDGSGQTLGSVFLELTLETPRGNFETSAFIGEALAGAEPLDKELPAFVKKIVDEVVHALVMNLRADVSTDAQLVSLVAGDDPAAWLPAIAMVRKRKVRAAAPALVARLKAQDREVVNLAAGALGEVGERTAVPALIDAGSRVEAVDRLPVLYAVGELGGPEAIIYLETVEKNTDHPAVRAAAKTALERANRP